MTKLIKKQDAPTFKVGDKVTFLIENPDVHANYPQHFITEYGIISKVNRITVIIDTLDGFGNKRYMSEIKHYIDPFAGFDLK